MASEESSETALGFVRTPIAVVVDEEEWTTRSLDRILTDAGYGVLTASDAVRAGDVLSRVGPDVLFVDLALSQPSGVDYVRELRTQGRVGEHTPVIALTRERLSRDQRFAALEAGAWEVVGLPFDADDLLLRLAPMVRAKQRVDDAREESLVDAVTGLYNTRGVLQKLSELRAAATRQGRSLACLVVGPREEPTPMDGPSTGGTAAADAIGLRVREAAESSVNRVWRATRRSDAKGAIGHARFVVVAPDTDAEGAQRLAERIIADGDADADEWVAGLFAESDLEASPVTASDFLARASDAFRQARSAGAEARVLDYRLRQN